MTTHELKTWPEFFGPVISGEKPFECRYNDRGFAVGDILHLREYDPKTNPADPYMNVIGYTGRECFRRVTYVLEGRRGAFGVQAGFVVLGLSEAYIQCKCRECKQDFWHSQDIDVCSEMCWRAGMQKAYDAHQ